jgi:hypothetical protein
MKLPALLLALLLCTFTLTARAASPVTSQPRAVPAFTRIDIRAPIQTDVHEGRPALVTVQVDDPVQKYVVARVSGDTLIVEIASHGNADIDLPRSARVSIDVPSLSGITLAGPSDIHVDAAGAHPQVDLNLLGPGDLHWNGNADVVRCRLDGPGNVLLHGSAKRLEAELNGPGSLDARAFPVTGGSFEVGGPGRVIVDLHGGDVSVAVNGPGSFHYSGDAHFTRMEVNGPGNIRKL